MTNRAQAREDPMMATTILLLLLLISGLGAGLAAPPRHVLAPVKVAPRRCRD
jgi:hypothetical protein